MTRQLEYDYFITPDGIQYNLNDLAKKFLLTIEGTGMPEIDYISQQGPFQHGITITDYRLRPRTIQMLVKLRGDCRQEWYDFRDELLNHLRPNRTQFPLTTLAHLRKIRPDKSIRQIDVFIKQGPLFTARKLDEWLEYTVAESLSFIAPDPTFYDPTDIEYEWEVDAFDHLIFPITFPPAGIDIIFGSSIISTSISIPYTGTWITYPTITVYGPLYGITIDNLSTGESITLNYNVQVGETVTINLQYGNKRIISSTNGDLTGSVSSDSNLATFHIAPDPEVTDGINEIRVTGSNAVVGTTSVVLTYNTRYIGY